MSKAASLPHTFGTAAAASDPAQNAQGL